MSGLSRDHKPKDLSANEGFPQLRATAGSTGARRRVLLMFSARMVAMGDVDWAGVPFLAVFHHDGHFFRSPGLYAFVRNRCGLRTLLFVDHADNIATATEHHRLWGEIVRLGCNELNVNVKTREKIDRLVLRAHIIKRCEPLLNVLEDAALPCPAPTPRMRA